MAYSVWDYGAESWVSHGQSFPRKGMAEGFRKDPTNLVTNCPADLKGPSGERYGWMLEVVTEASRTEFQKAGPREYDAAPDLDEGTVGVTITAVDMSTDERIDKLSVTLGPALERSGTAALIRQAEKSKKSGDTATGLSLRFKAVQRGN